MAGFGSAEIMDPGKKIIFLIPDYLLRITADNST
jgi:hypothetical protein